MSKALSGWQQLFKTGRSQHGSRDRKTLSRWLVGLLTIVFLWSWNWQLFLAIAAGIALMVFSYLLQNGKLQPHWQKWQRFLTGSNRKFAIAVLSGGLGSFSTYLGATIWTDSENRWLATGSILQGLGSLLTLSLLGWYIWQNKQDSTEIRLEKLLVDLGDEDPLKRLVAIRQLTRLLQRDRLAAEYYYQILECYRLMLSQPQVPIVRTALLDSLQILGIPKVSPASSQRRVVKIPINLEPSTQAILDNLSRD